MVTGKCICAGCTSTPIIYLNTSFAPGMTVINADVLCSGCGALSLGYVWASTRVRCTTGTTGPGISPCSFDNIFTIGDGNPSHCNGAASTDCMVVDPTCGGCGSMTGIFTVGASGDATVDLN